MHSRIEELLQYLDAQRQALHAAVERVPPDRREQSPGPGRWSVAEILEHVSLAETTITRLLTSRLAEARERGLGPDPETSPVLATIDVAGISDRSYQVAASEASRPRAGLDSATAWNTLESIRKVFREAILAGDGLALGEVIHPRPHPVLGVMNLYQWIAFAGAHEARHTAQILEIAAAFAERPQFAIRPSRAEDVPEIVRVVNAAFEVERFFVDGQRTSVEEVRGMLDRGTFLLAEDGGPLAACVYLKIRPGDAYFGMLSVDPARQGEGLGRLLVEAAEKQARHAGCEGMEIHVVDLRTELPPFYRRLGYVETGTEPMPPDPKFRIPCRFIVMRKPLI